MWAKGGLGPRWLRGGAAPEGEGGSWGEGPPRVGRRGGSERRSRGKVAAVALPLVRTALRADKSSDFYFNLLNHLVGFFYFQ